MPDLINGRTPEEIRKGLECCTPRYESKHWVSCHNECPYRSEGVFCRNVLQKDIKALIRQLERDRNVAAQENTALRADLKEADAIECSHCLHFRTEEQTDPCIEADYDCDSCKNEKCKCRSCREGNPNWEWRGIQKDMKEEER